MTSCTRCPRPARWRTPTEALCGTHAADEALRGRPVALAPLEDVADRLEAISGWDGDTAGVELCMEAAAEIRSLRARVAALEAGQSAGDRPLASGGRLDGGSVTQTHGG